MPFLCDNTTNIQDACSSLLKYCNNRYAIQNDWCNCIQYNYDSKCSINLAIVVGIPVGICGPLFLGFCILIIGIQYEKYIKNKKLKLNVNMPNNDTQPPNYYPRELIPIETSVRANRTTNLLPMTIEDITTEDTNTDTQKQDDNIEINVVKNEYPQEPPPKYQ